MSFEIDIFAVKKAGASTAPTILIGGHRFEGMPGTGDTQTPDCQTGLRERQAFIHGCYPTGS